MSTTKSTALSKPSKKTVKKKMTTKKEFDMTPAGRIVYYPHLAGLPIPPDSKLTIKHIVDAVEVAKKRNWCSWYTREEWTDNEKCRAYTACHADLKNAGYEDSFYLDLVNWQKLPEAAIPNAKKIYNMLVSKDSPWADALENVYLIYNEEGDRLLGVYSEQLGRDIPKGCRRLFVNFLIALRCVSEHRTSRDAYKENNTFKTLLGWFIYTSVACGFGHNWIHYGVRGRDWVRKLFLKQHSLEQYGRERDCFTSFCNSVYLGTKEDHEKLEESIKEVEKELNYV